MNAKNEQPEIQTLSETMPVFPNTQVIKEREESKVLEGALQELDMAPDYASTAYYVIPFRNYETGRTTNVEGPSSKAAMCLARRWGNCWNGARVAEQQEDRVVVQGIFHDAETNLTTMRSVSVSKFYLPKGTKVKTPLREDRLNIAIQAGMSKAVRNAILASLPTWLVDQYVKKAKGIAVTLLTTGKDKPTEKDLKARLEAMAKAFASQGVTAENLKVYMDNLGEVSGNELLEHMIGVFNALKDGQTSVDEVFAEKPKEKEPQPVNLKEVLGE